MIRPNLPALLRDAKLIKDTQEDVNAMVVKLDTTITLCEALIEAREALKKVSSRPYLPSCPCCIFSDKAIANLNAKIDFGSEGE